MKHELTGCRREVDARLDAQDARMKIIEENTRAILDIVSAWNNAKGFVRVIQAISTTIRVTAIPLAAITALWYLITTGHLPPK